MSPTSVRVALLVVAVAASNYQSINQVINNVPHTPDPLSGVGVVVPEV